MSKLEIEFELTGLKFKIKGDSDEVVARANAVQKQVQGMLQGIGAGADGGDGSKTTTLGSGAGQKVIEAVSEPTESSRKGGTRRGTKKAGSSIPQQAGDPIEFRHNSTKYGNPQQSWSNTNKAIWLLFVLKDDAQMAEVTGPRLAMTFNHHFKGAGVVRPSHITRELGRAKMKNPALVGEDKKQEPSLWYLTDEGVKFAQQIIGTVLRPAS